MNPEFTVSNASGVIGQMTVIENPSLSNVIQVYTNDTSAATFGGGDQVGWAGYEFYDISSGNYVPIYESLAQFDQPAVSQPSSGFCQGWDGYIYLGNLGWTRECTGC